MTYIPSEYRGQGVTEIPAGHRPARMPAGVSVARELRTVSGSLENRDGRDVVVIQLESGKELCFNSGTILRLGASSPTLADIYTFTYEDGDYIDVAFVNGNSDAFWVSIRYVDPENRPEQGNFVAKDDGDFAYRTKSGEKAERLVTQKLTDLGHSFDPALYQHSGFFEIRYKGKRNRKPDRTCSQCGTKFEVKKRNRDRYYRVSHSDTRPFNSENEPQDYHVFVFPDLSLHFLKNSSIQSILRQKEGTTTWRSGRENQLDSYAELLSVNDDAEFPCTT